MTDPLADCALKLGRAFDHLEGLCDSIERFRESKPYTLAHTFNAERDGEYLATGVAQLVKPRPPEWPILIGEFLYHCHSTLDQLMWKLATRANYGFELPEGTRVTFPIFKNRSRFWRRDKAGHFRTGSAAERLRHVPGDARGLLLDLQPYKRRNHSAEHPLWLLHDLSNEDKHKAIHVAASAVAGKRLQHTELQDLKITSFDTRGEPFKTRAEISWIRFARIGPKPKLKTQPGFRIEEAFAGGGAAKGRPVHGTLQEIWNFIREDVFEARFAPYFNSTLFTQSPPD